MHLPSVFLHWARDYTKPRNFGYNITDSFLPCHIQNRQGQYYIHVHESRQAFPNHSFSVTPIQWEKEHPRFYLLVPWWTWSPKAELQKQLFLPCCLYSTSASYLLFRNYCQEMFTANMLGFWQSAMWESDKCFLVCHSETESSWVRLREVGSGHWNEEQGCCVHRNSRQPPGESYPETISKITAEQGAGQPQQCYHVFKKFLWV